MKGSTKILLFLLAGAAVFLGLSFFGDLPLVLETFRDFSPTLMALALMFASFNYLFRFFRWKYYLKLLHIGLSTRDSAAVFFSGLAMSVSPGKFGELVKSYFIKKINGTPMSRSAPLVLAERLTDVVSVVVLCVVGSLTYRFGMPLIAGSLALIGGFLFLVSSRRLATSLLKSKLEQAYESTYELLRPKPLLVATIIGCAAWFWEAFAFWMVLGGCGIALSLTRAVFIYAFSTLAGALSMLPGGLAATEISLTGLVIASGAERSPAVVATMIIRVCTLWFAVAVGMASALSSRKRLGGEFPSAGHVQ